MTVLSTNKSKSKTSSKSRSRSRSNRKYRNKNKNKNRNTNKNKNKHKNDDNNNNNNNKMEIDSDDSHSMIISNAMNDLNDLNDLNEFNELSECTSPSTTISITTSPSSNSSNTDSHSHSHFNFNSNSTILKSIDSPRKSVSASHSYLDALIGAKNKNKHKNKNDINAMDIDIDQNDDDENENEHEMQQQQEKEEYDDDDDGDDGDDEEEEEEEEQKEEQREFRFNIENDENLQNLINNNNFVENVEDDYLSSNDKELRSDYILSKLYNYMKISEMSKYGISVFKVTFSSYLPYLNECDLFKLSTSYWCNGQHFQCMISHRGDIIKSELENKCVLQLRITSDLLDSAMQSGASVDKIEAMLLQKRIDDGIYIKKHQKYHRFYHTKNEKNFYVRNLKHRFWNHEVLVRVFIQNQWLTPNLAQIAMKTFIKTIYHRVLQSKSAFIHNNNTRKGNGGDIKFSENFLHSFFVSYFCLDDIPKMYKKEIKQKYNDSNGNNINYVNLISEETLRRWCELIELLASRGGIVSQYEFRKIIPLQYALQIGKNTYNIISSSHQTKNQQLIPNKYHQQNISVPNDIWDVLISYL